MSMSVLPVFLREETPGESDSLQLISEVRIGYAQVERPVARIQNLIQRGLRKQPDPVLVFVEPLQREPIHCRMFRRTSENGRPFFLNHLKDSLAGGPKLL